MNENSEEVKIEQVEDTRTPQEKRRDSLRYRREYIAEQKGKYSFLAALYFAISDKGPSFQNKIGNTEKHQESIDKAFHNKLSKRRAKNKVARATRSNQR